MNILILMVPMALLLGFGFVCAFAWSVRKGQMDDLETPAMRMLLDDEKNNRVHLQTLKQDDLRAANELEMKG